MFQFQEIILFQGFVTGRANNSVGKGDSFPYWMLKLKTHAMVILTKTEFCRFLLCVYSQTELTMAILPKLRKKSIPHTQHAAPVPDVSCLSGWAAVLCKPPRYALLLNQPEHLGSIQPLEEQVPV